jgi:hypothetical protein
MKTPAATLAEYEQRKERDGTDKALAWLYDNDDEFADRMPAPELTPHRYNVVNAGYGRYVERY